MLHGDGSSTIKSSNKGAYDPSLFTFSNAARDIVIGSLAGMLSEIAEYPLDLAKVRLQAQVLSATHPSQLRFNGTVDCLKQTWKDEGFRGLYRGLPVPLAGSMAITAALFVSYTSFQDAIRACTSRTRSDRLSIPELALAAAGSGFVTSYVVTPFELVKCRMQVQTMNLSSQQPHPASISSKQPLPIPAFSPTHGPSLLSPSDLRLDSSRPPARPPGPLGIIRSAIQQEGFRGLWRGHTGTIVRDSSGCAGWFAIKEWVAEALVQRRAALRLDEISKHQTEFTWKPVQESMSLRPWESAVAGAVSGAVCAMAVYPADTVKSAMQTEDELRPTSLSIRSASAKASARTFSGTLMRMYTSHGLRGLYAGCGMTVVRAVPSSGILFVVYDDLSKWWG